MESSVDCLIYYPLYLEYFISFIPSVDGYDRHAKSSHTAKAITKACHCHDDDDTDPVYNLRRTKCQYYSTDSCCQKAYHLFFQYYA